MMTERRLEQILARYQNSFTAKIYAEENEEHDILRDVFGIYPIIKKENRQYWGRELGIDTKYRIGSGDSGTLKKFKSYGELLRNLNYDPVFLILRQDNLPAAITACQKGTWKVYTGDDSFEFIQTISGFDLKSFLIGKVG